MNEARARELVKRITADNQLDRCPLPEPPGSIADLLARAKTAWPAGVTQMELTIPFTGFAPEAKAASK